MKSLFQRDQVYRPTPLVALHLQPSLQGRVMLQPAIREDAARISECFSLQRPHRIQYWGKDACWSALGQTKADLGHSLSKYVSCKDRVVSEVTFLHHHILPSPSLQWLVRFQFCLALRHLSLHSSIPALPSLTHYLTIK